MIGIVQDQKPPLACLVVAIEELPSAVSRSRTAITHRPQYRFKCAKRPEHLQHAAAERSRVACVHPPHPPARSAGGLSRCERHRGLCRAHPCQPAPTSWPRAAATRYASGEATGGAPPATTADHRPRPEAGPSEARQKDRRPARSLQAPPEPEAAWIGCAPQAANGPARPSAQPQPHQSPCQQPSNTAHHS